MFALDAFGKRLGKLVGDYESGMMSYIAKRAKRGQGNLQGGLSMGFEGFYSCPYNEDLWRVVEAVAWPTPAELSKIQAELELDLRLLKQPAARAAQPAPAPKAAASSPNVTPPAAKAGKPMDLQKQSLDTRACGALVAHPGWSDTQIAEHLGCSRTSLYRLPGFRRARRVQGESKKDNLRQGHWDAARGQAVPSVGDEDRNGKEIRED